jgi:hypothetical protein
MRFLQSDCEKVAAWKFYDGLATRNSASLFLSHFAASFLSHLWIILPLFSFESSHLKQWGCGSNGHGRWTIKGWLC